MTTSTAACLEVASLVDEDVFWLQIAVDDVQCVQVLESQDDLSGIERSVCLATATKKTSASNE